MTTYLSFFIQQTAPLNNKLRKLKLVDLSLLNLESLPQVSVTEFAPLFLTLLVLSLFLAPPVLHLPQPPLFINGNMLKKEGITIKSSAAQAKHVHNRSSSCCVDWCSDVKLCCR